MSYDSALIAKDTQIILKEDSYMNMSRLISNRYKRPYKTLHKWLQRFFLLHFGFSNHLNPISHRFGFDRGQPVDRHYIEIFLDKHRADIKGRVLEVQEPVYTDKFGGSSVYQSEVIDIVSENPKATIVGNLETGEGLPSNAFDCIIITQTYQYLYDLKKAVQNNYRILKPYGVLLATFPAVTKVSRDNMISQYFKNTPYKLVEYWRFTDTVVKRLFDEIFGSDNVSIETYGNVLAASAFLYGLAANELDVKKLNYHDPDYQIIIASRVVKRPSLEGIMRVAS
jgi:SAM-dependent methyltransferase